MKVERVTTAMMAEPIKTLQLHYPMIQFLMTILFNITLNILLCK